MRQRPKAENSAALIKLAEIEKAIDALAREKDILSRNDMKERTRHLTNMLIDLQSVRGISSTKKKKLADRLSVLSPFYSIDDGSEVTLPASHLNDRFRKSLN